MDRSAKPKDRDGEEQALYHRDDGGGGRGTDDTHTGNSVVPDSQGGTGDRGCDGDPKHHHGNKPEV